MKVILTQEVDNLGLAGDVVDVANGYGRNFLLPRGMAILATKGAMKEAEALTRSRKVVEAQTLDQAVEHRTTLEDRTLRIPARVDERGHLYGSVTVNDVHRVLKERGHEIERKRIDLKGSIKEIGTYEIPVQVHPQVMATVVIDVVDEEGVVIAGQIAAPEVAPLPGEVVEAEATDADADGDTAATPTTSWRAWRPRPWPPLPSSMPPLPSRAADDADRSRLAMSSPPTPEHRRTPCSTLGRASLHTGRRPSCTLARRAAHTPCGSTARRTNVGPVHPAPVRACRGRGRWRRWTGRRPHVPQRVPTTGSRRTRWTRRCRCSGRACCRARRPSRSWNCSRPRTSTGAPTPPCTKPIQEVMAGNRALDPVTLLDHLAGTSRLDEVGGAPAIHELVSATPTAANATFYAQIVRDKAMLRRLIEAGTDIVRMGYEPTDDPVLAVSEAESRMFEVSDQGARNEASQLKDLLNESYAMIEERAQQGDDVTGLATGFTDLDRITAGFQPQNLIVLAARPAMGKSSLVLSMAHYVTASLNKPVVFFSLEMSKQEIVMRLLSSEGSIDSQKIKTGKLEDSDWLRLADALGALSDAPLFIDDTPSINLMEIMAKSRRIKQRHGLELIIVDYLQLMQSHRRVDNRQQEVAEISRGLKMLAKELNVPVIALSQLNRSPEMRQDKRPMLADLRESGSVEQDADIVAFIYRDEVYHEDTMDKGIAELIISKHRNGDTGTVKMAFVGHLTKFANLARGRPGQPVAAAVAGAVPVVARVHRGRRACPRQVRPRRAGQSAARCERLDRPYGARGHAGPCVAVGVVRSIGLRSPGGVGHACTGAAVRSSC